MYQVLNADNRDEMVQVAMISRCFIVGFRYFRQTEATKFRILQAMSSEIVAILGADPVFLESTNLTKFFISVAKSHHITEPEAWAADVMFLISPAMWRPQDMTLMEANEAWAITISVVPAGLTADFSLAVGGNAFMSSEYNRIFDKHTPVFDEDAYPEAMLERPVLEEGFQHNWRELLTQRRREQLLKYTEFVERVVEVDAPAQSTEVSDPVVDVNPEDDIDR